MGRRSAERLEIIESRRDAVGLPYTNM